VFVSLQKLIALSIFTVAINYIQLTIIACLGTCFTCNNKEYNSSDAMPKP